MDKLQINPIDDHDPRFNVDKSALEKSNNAIRMLSSLKKNEAGIEVEIVGDKIIHKRTEEEYEKIWAKFLNEEEIDFKERFSYGRDIIEKIGVKKFIDTHDWRNEDDVSKWRTDAANIVVCLHCADNFAPLQFVGNLGFYGLCSECSKLYDLDKITRVAKAKTEDEAYLDIPDANLRLSLARTRVIEQFVLDNEFRKHFLIPMEN